jgi:hypothetical protein
MDDDDCSLNAALDQALVRGSVGVVVDKRQVVVAT